jgi:hypothetical protein
MTDPTSAASTPRSCHPESMEPPPGYAFQHVVHRGFVLAAETDERCRPIHLLAALSELDGPIAEALRPPGGGPLLPRPADPPVYSGGGTSYLSLQTQEAAGDLASERNEDLNAAHLLLAVIDQAEPEAVALLNRAGVGTAAARIAALDILGAPRDLPVIPIPPLTPAGTLDRPALRADQLDPAAWEILTWRQTHLPLDALQTPKDWDCLENLEDDVAHRLARKLDADQQTSLLIRHRDEVRAIARRARPDLVPASRWSERSFGLPQGRTVTNWIDHRRRPNYPQLHRRLGLLVLQPHRRNQHQMAVAGNPTVLSSDPLRLPRAVAEVRCGLNSGQEDDAPYPGVERGGRGRG